MYADVIWDLKEIAVLECENMKYFLLILMFCQYNVVYNAIP